MSRTGSFKPFSGKKTYVRDDWKAPRSMSKLTSGAWEKGKTLTEKQKKRVHVNGR